MTNTLLPVEADTIRRAYLAGLSIFARCPETRAGVLALHDELRRYVDLLMPEVLAIAPRARGDMRAASVHVLVRGHEVLEELGDAEPISEEDAPLDGRSRMRDRDAVFELAILCRSYLSVVTRPGPLGEPTGVDEIQKAIGRRVCGACWQPIADGEPVERKVFLNNSGAGICGFVHAEPCAPRRPVLVRVPAQPSRL